MALIPDVSQRRRSPELMDAPELDDAEHELALRGLIRINAFTDAVGLIWSPVRRFIRTAMRSAERAGQPPPALRLLDLASGAGDVTTAIAYRASQANYNLAVSGCDLSPCAVRFAQLEAERYHLPVVYSERNVLSEPLPAGFDIITCSLFLHHLDESDAVKLLAAMKAAGPRLIVLQDLCRSRWGYLLATWGTKLLTRSKVVHVDAGLSVEGAFTRGEMQALADEAGLTGARVVPHWPARLVLTWEAPA
ncbi:MAG TPA: methyltransferase domain-containing protein [Planctomycetota bacterium]|nr:methyltransferase domain-containing protein [Planctomycetota bacterium]